MRRLMRNTRCNGFGVCTFLPICFLLILCVPNAGDQHRPPSLIAQWIDLTGAAQMSLIDLPIRQDEEDQFYGKTVTQSEWAEARARHFRAWDADDVAEAAYEMAPQIVEALDNGAFGKLASLFLEYRNATVERRCEYELLGKITTPVYVPPATDAQAERSFERTFGVNA